MATTLPPLEGTPRIRVHLVDSRKEGWKESVVVSDRNANVRNAATIEEAAEAAVQAVFVLRWAASVRVSRVEYKTDEGWKDLEKPSSSPAPRTRKHRYCGGKGFIRLASGAETICQPCNGTGTLVLVSAAERRAREEGIQRFMATCEILRKRAREVETPTGTTRLIFSLDIVRRFEMLAGKEPQRLGQLYRSVEQGRLDDVIWALYAYQA
jgi:hypothetical protein